MPFIISIDDPTPWSLWWSFLDAAIQLGIAPAELKELADAEVADVRVEKLDEVMAFAKSLPDWDLGGSQPNPFTVHCVSL